MSLEPIAESLPVTGYKPEKARKVTSLPFDSAYGSDDTSRQV
jgi:hypothetical protein